MPLLYPSASSHPSPEEIWATAFNEFGQRIRHAFVRPEPYHRALAYIQGLMSEASRKNGWQVAEAVGETILAQRMVNTYWHLDLAAHPACPDK